MTDIVGSLTTELRITGRIFRETVMGLKRTGWMNVIIVITMASILSIFGVVMAIIMEMGVLIHNVGTELEISAYLKDQSDAADIRTEVLKLPHIKKITLISKEKAWNDMQKDYPLPDIENPLPDTIHLQMTSENYIPATVEKLRTMGGIESVQYAKQILDKVRSITQGATIVGIAVSFFLGVLTLFIISNTIHLLIQGKSREIEILRMMGVGNWYIRLPFLIQGAVYGLAGSLISALPLSIAVFYITRFFDYLGFTTNEMTTNYVFLILLLMGILVGSGGASLAIRKYLEI
jgi:cell division transport system permease protein